MLVAVLRHHVVPVVLTRFHSVVEQDLHESLSKTRYSVDPLLLLSAVLGAIFQLLDKLDNEEFS